MNKPVGGRGKKAPYASITKRVPIPIESQVDELIERYRLEVMEGIKPDDHQLPSIDDVKQLAKKMLKAKTSKSITIAKLITAIYNIPVTADELAE
jgi:hypothetical protein